MQRVSADLPPSNAPPPLLVLWHVREQLKQLVPELKYLCVLRALSESGGSRHGDLLSSQSNLPDGVSVAAYGLPGHLFQLDRRTQPQWQLNMRITAGTTYTCVLEQQ